MSPTRPRVEGDREEEILDATLEELLETGYDRLTMDAVAKRSRASKATLYRRWESKAALVVDAVARAKGAPHVEVPDTGTLRGDLVGTFCGDHGPASQTAAMVVAAVVTGLTSDPDFAERFRASFIAPKAALTAQIYARAEARGEIRPGLDLEVVGPALAAVVLHHSFVLGQSADDAFVERVVDQLILPAVLDPAHTDPARATEPALT